MPLTSTSRYQRVADEDVPNLEKTSEETDVDFESDSSATLMGHSPGWSSRSSSKSRAVSRVLAIANFVLFAVLLGTWLSIIIKNLRRYCPDGPPPPYSIVREQGAVKWVNKVFKPSLIFQSPPSPEVDDAWNQTLEYDNSIGLTREFVDKHNIHRSVEWPQDTSKMIYGVSVFHQLHCLDVIRQSLYPDHYFPSKPHEEMSSHFLHCFDFLRQAIMCKADVSVIYWWNANFTTIGEDGVARDSDYYLGLTPEQRVRQSFVKWDVEHQCHDIDVVIKWLDDNRIDRGW